MGVFTEVLQAHLSTTQFTQATMELGDKVITLAAKPLTAADMMAIKRAHPDFGNNPTLEGMVDLLILKARVEDGDGQKAFDKADKPFLLRLDMNLIGNVFGDLFSKQMAATSDESTVDEKKTS